MSLYVQTVIWHLRYLLSCRDLESIFAERGLDVDHSTIGRVVWVVEI
jgi:transposase, IS6 family